MLLPKITNLSFMKDLYEKSGDNYNIPISVILNCRKNSSDYIDFANNFIAPIIGKNVFRSIVGIRDYLSMLLKVMKHWHCLYMKTIMNGG
jgi:hypothetical protein